MKDIVNELLADYRDVKLPMLGEGHLDYILNNLASVLKVPGDVVELGCNIGMTTSFMRRLLDKMESIKRIHVYESFQGLPDKTDGDGASHSVKGESTVTKDAFINTFGKAGLGLPVINAGWFAEIPDENYPDLICFAFFDGDFYTSIMDSFNKVYHKMSPGGIILIHDYDYVVYPGTKKACADFLKDKPEKEICEISGIAKIIKASK